MEHERELYDFLEERDDLDGVVLFTDGMHSVRSPSCFEYFAGASPVGERNCLLVSPTDDPVILVDLPRDVQRLQRWSSVRDISGSEEFTASLTALLEERDLTGSVGLVGSDRMSLPIYRALDRQTTRIEHVDDALGRRIHRTNDRELEIFRRLGEIADRGFEAAYETVRPGMKEYEIAAEVEYAMHSAGAEDNFNLLSTGSHNELMHSPTERIVEEGDTFLCELSPMYEGYILQICRTISVGTPGPELTEKYALLTEALERTKSKLRAGTEASVISETMNDVFRTEGYGEYCRPPYMRTRGHEFGYGPIGMAITEETDIDLAEGMILVIHPNQYVPETGYLALGDPIVVEEDGVKTLTDTAPRLFTKEVVR